LNCRLMLYIASSSAARIPWTLGSVPLVPVVTREALARKRNDPSSPTLPTHTSVVEFPISTPAISFKEEFPSFHKLPLLPEQVSHSGERGISPGAPAP